MTTLKDYTKHHRGKWFEVCLCYHEKPGSDEGIKVIAKFLDANDAINYASQCRKAMVGPDEIIVR